MVTGWLVLMLIALVVLLLKPRAHNKTMYEIGSSGSVCGSGMRKKHVHFHPSTVFHDAEERKPQVCLVCFRLHKSHVTTRRCTGCNAQVCATTCWYQGQCPHCVLRQEVLRYTSTGKVQVNTRHTNASLPYVKHSGVEGSRIRHATHSW